MLKDNKEIIESFRLLHDNYALNPDYLQKQFNKEGGKILALIREYENRLCRNTERGMYSKYSVALAEKFQNEVRKHFPMIDRVGLILEETDPKISKPEFAIKKIYLS